MSNLSIVNSAIKLQLEITYKADGTVDHGNLHCLTFCGDALCKIELTPTQVGRLFREFEFLKNNLDKAKPARMVKACTKTQKKNKGQSKGSRR